jgi:uncharacterized membrane protein
MLTIEIANLIAFIIFIICIIAYGIKLQVGMKHPASSKRGLLNIFYQLWVNAMADSKNKIEAIQTMRNLIMSVTFLSSTMLILLGLLIQSYTNGVDDMLINFSVVSSTIVVQYKLLLLFAVLIVSLIMFLLSLRHMVRFSILIGIPIPDIEETGSNQIQTEKKDTCNLNAKALQSDIFLKAMTRFTIGIRGVYYVVAILLWFISAYAFMIATILITYILIKYHDIKTPCLDEKTVI